jgi:glutathionylspermidine synthase
VFQTKFLNQHKKSEFLHRLSGATSFVDWLHEVLASLFTEAVEQGELEPFDITYTTDTLMENLHPHFYHFLRQERGFSSERILAGLCHIYIDGLRSGQSKLPECRD